jgi:putative membrane protein
MFRDMESVDREDPRIFMAAERTYLAWVRTGVALMGFGFVVARFGLFLREISAARSIPNVPQPRAFTVPIGIILIGLGVIVTGFAAVNHSRYVAALKSGTFVAGFHSRYPAAVAGILVVLGTVMAFYLALI